MGASHGKPITIGTGLGASNAYTSQCYTCPSDTTTFSDLYVARATFYNDPVGYRCVYTGHDYSYKSWYEVGARGFGEKINWERNPRYAQCYFNSDGKLLAGGGGIGGVSTSNCPSRAPRDDQCLAGKDAAEEAARRKATAEKEAAEEAKRLKAALTAAEHLATNFCKACPWLLSERYSTSLIPDRTKLEKACGFCKWPEGSKPQTQDFVDAFLEFMSGLKLGDSEHSALLTKMASTPAWVEALARSYGKIAETLSGSNDTVATV